MRWMWLSGDHVSFRLVFDLRLRTFAEDWRSRNGSFWQIFNDRAQFLVNGSSRFLGTPLRIAPAFALRAQPGEDCVQFEKLRWLNSSESKMRYLISGCLRCGRFSRRQARRIKHALEQY